MCATVASELARHRALLDVLDEREEAAEAALLDSVPSRSAPANRARMPRRPGDGGWNWFDSLRRFFTLPHSVPDSGGSDGADGARMVRAPGTRRRSSAASGPDLGSPCFPTSNPSSPADSGKVRIAVDEVQRHVVIGNLRRPPYSGIAAERGARGIQSGRARGIDRRAEKQRGFGSGEAGADRCGVARSRTPGFV